MPELPEVEEVRRTLIAAVRDEIIDGVTVLRPDYVRHGRKTIRNLKGSGIIDITRLGKRLFWQLTPSACMVTHLGMTGRITLRPDDKPAEPHTHLVLGLKTGKFLHFSDARRFGGVWLYAAESQALQAHVTGRLGADALNLAVTDLDGWKQKRVPLKAELLSQKTVAGLGNIYVDEALWMARLHPLRRVDQLPHAARALLTHCIHEVLHASLAMGGTTLRDYRDANANAGRFAQSLNVYGRAGQPCRRCGTTLRKFLIAQRTTVICPKCQRAGRHRIQK